jgi:hypothetical protein
MFDRKKYINKYNVKNRLKIKKAQKEYHKIHREELRQWTREYRHINLESWIGIIPRETKCQICSRTIYFNLKNPKNAIHFDHKQEHSIIKNQPIAFLRSSPRTPKREKIWKKADLGMLCVDCNSYLPTKNRKKYIKKVIKYVFGDN